MSAMAGAATGLADDLLGRAMNARRRAAGWLLDHIASDGTPAASDIGNGWSRLPWSLALAGETATGHAVLNWAERHALDHRGWLTGGPAYGDGRFSAYPVGHLAMGAWLLQRFDAALKLNAQLRQIADPATGGMAIDPPGGLAADLADLLSTAQAGLAALLAGQDDIVDGAYRWISTLHQQQPDLPQTLYCARRRESLLTAPPEGLAWLLKVDFSQPRQAYFYPGIAAAFLAAYALRRRDQAAVALGHSFLGCNLQGTDAQFDDREQVQICKFGWGAAALQIADPTVDYRAHLRRMAEWFIAQQGPAGNWGPSRYFGPDPKLHDRMTKTAEHLMELDAIIAALGSLAARR